MTQNVKWEQGDVWTTKVAKGYEPPRTRSEAWRLKPRLEGSEARLRGLALHTSLRLQPPGNGSATANAQRSLAAEAAARG